MPILATVLTSEWTPAEVHEPREMWGTDSISVTDQWVTGDTLRSYCQRRLELDDGDLEIQAMRELRTLDASHSEARFGVAVLALQSVVGEPLAKGLREELALLAQLMKDPDGEGTQSILEIDAPEAQAAAALRRQIVDELKASHGGKKLKQRLEICTDQETLVELAGTLLERPDEPAEDVPSQVRGTPDLVSFKHSWVKLDTPDTAARGKLLVSDPEIFDKILDAGRTHAVVTLNVRTLDPRAPGPKIEVTAFAIEARNAAPLTA